MTQNDWRIKSIGCCKKSTRKKNDLKKGAPKKAHRQDLISGGKG